MEERSLRWNIFAKMHRSITLYVQAHFSVSHYENSFPFRLARLISWHFTLWAMSNSCGHAEVGSYAEKSRTFLTEYEAKFSAQGKNINFVRIWTNGRNIAGWYFLHNQQRERKPHSRKDWSGQRESNPPPQLGKLIFYQWTMSARQILRRAVYMSNAPTCFIIHPNPRNVYPQILFRRLKFQKIQKNPAILRREK